MSIDTDRFRTLLEEERGRVKHAIDHLHDEHPGSIEDETDELATASDNHMGDLATATLNREIDYSLGANSEQHLAEIDAALKRIDDGTYGTCTKCGKQIGAERLEAMPWAALCIDDARAQEQRA
jgi:RNA polymerase-binding protein DksA